MKAHDNIKFNGVLLDNFLSQGYYRMRQEIFTTDFIFDKENIYQVYWLRFLLSNFTFSAAAQKLLKANSNFIVTIKPFAVSKEITTLYQSYYSNVQFDAPPTMQDFLFGDNVKDNSNLFESMLIEIRDETKLIAAGIFDKGATALAGIMNFFDPAYKKYSLGKYLMLLKIKHAIELGMKYYYPGYIAFRYPKFDYKLFPNARFAQVYESRKKQWHFYTPGILQQLSIRTLQ